MSRADKMYKGSPRLEREDGKMKAKKGPTEAEKKSAEVNSGTAGVPQTEVHARQAKELTDAHARHAAEIADMVKRHAKEHKGIAKEGGKAEPKAEKHDEKPKE